MICNSLTLNLISFSRTCTPDFPIAWNAERPREQRHAVQYPWLCGTNQSEGLLSGYVSKCKTTENI